MAKGSYPLCSATAGVKIECGALRSRGVDRSIVGLSESRRVDS